MSQPFRFRPSRRHVLATGVGLLVSPGASAAEERAGEVKKVVGTASATSASAAATASARTRGLDAHDPVLIEDLIQTGRKSRLDLLLGQRTTLKLGEQTGVRIDRYLIDAGGEIEVLDGAVEFERTGEKAKEDLTFRSAYGLIAVRGTRFYAGRHRGKFSVLVGVGRVEVTAGGRSVLVGPQQGIDIAVPGAQPTTPATWKLPRIREFTAQFR